jgi:hypothetical protein
MKYRECEVILNVLNDVYESRPPEVGKVAEAIYAVRRTMELLKRAQVTSCRNLTEWKVNQCQQM